MDVLLFRGLAVHISFLTTIEILWLYLPLYPSILPTDRACVLMPLMSDYGWSYQKFIRKHYLKNGSATDRTLLYLEVVVFCSMCRDESCASDFPYR